MRHSRLVLAGRTLKDVREAAARVSKAFDSSRDAAGPLRPLALVALLRMVYEYPVVTTVFDKQTRRLTARCENLDDLPGGGEGPRDFSMTGVATMIGALGGGDEVKEVVIEASGATDALVVLSDTDLLQEASSGESVEELLTQEAEAGGLVQLVRMLSRLTDFHGLNQAFSGLKVCISHLSCVFLPLISLVFFCFFAVESDRVHSGGHQCPRRCLSASRTSSGSFFFPGFLRIAAFGLAANQIGLAAVSGRLASVGRVARGAHAIGNRVFRLCCAENAVNHWHFHRFDARRFRRKTAL